MKKTPDASWNSAKCIVCGQPLNPTTTHVCPSDTPPPIKRRDASDWNEQADQTEREASAMKELRELAPRLEDIFGHETRGLYKSGYADGWKARAAWQRRWEMSLAERISLIMARIEILKLKANSHDWQCNTPKDVKEQLEAELIKINALLENI